MNYIFKLWTTTTQYDIWTPLNHVIFVAQVYFALGYFGTIRCKMVCKKLIWSTELAIASSHVQFWFFPLLVLRLQLYSFWSHKTGMNATTFVKVEGYLLPSIKCHENLWQCTFCFYASFFLSLHHSTAFSMNKRKMLIFPH